MSWRLKDKLVGHWPLNNNAQDVSGNNYHGVWTVEDYEENCFGKSAGKFNGSTSKVTVENNSDLQGLFYGGGSISAWVRADSDGEADSARIINKNLEFLFYVGLESSGAMNIFFLHYFTAINGGWSSTSKEIKVKKGSNVIVTYNSLSVLNNPSFFVDGALVDLTKTSGPSGKASKNTNDFLIGNNDDNSRTFDGLIWNVKCFKDCELTYDEAIKLWKRDHL